MVYQELEDPKNWVKIAYMSRGRTRPSPSHASCSVHVVPDQPFLRWAVWKPWLTKIASNNPGDYHENPSIIPCRVHVYSRKEPQSIPIPKQEPEMSHPLRFVVGPTPMMFAIVRPFLEQSELQYCDPTFGHWAPARWGMADYFLKPIPTTSYLLTLDGFDQQTEYLKHLKLKTAKILPRMSLSFQRAIATSRPDVVLANHWRNLRAHGALRIHEVDLLERIPTGGELSTQTMGLSMDWDLLALPDWEETGDLRGWGFKAHTDGEKHPYFITSGGRSLGNGRGPSGRELTKIVESSEATNSPTDPSGGESPSGREQTVNRGSTETTGTTSSPPDQGEGQVREAILHFQQQEPGLGQLLENCLQRTLISVPPGLLLM